MTMDYLPAFPDPQPVPVMDVNGYVAAKHPVLAYMGRLNTPASRESMFRRLNVVAHLLTEDTMDALHFPWHQLTYVQVLAVKAKLAQTHAMQTTNVTLAAVKGVLRECWRLEYMSAEAQQRACDVSPVKGTRLRVGRALETTELTQLLYSCQHDRRRALSSRDGALFALLYGCGLRSSEAIGLDLKHYDAKTRILRVLGKGNRERELPCPETIAEALDRWLEIRGPWAGPLVAPVVHGGVVQKRRLNRRSINIILKRRRQVAGVEKFTPHDMRRSFVSNLLDSGVDLATTQALAGHSDPKTTSSYDRRGMRAKLAGMEKLPFPGL